jgi:phosphoribosylformylglycinamidine cyclo-ligase
VHRALGEHHSALTYRDAGVDIEAGEDAVRRIAPLARTTARAEVIGGIGAFASFVRVPAGYREPVLVSSTDGVGSKLKVAFAADRHDTVGIDLVAMGVNDLLVHGAEPLYFLDYIGTSKLDPPRVEAIVAGVAEGCRRAGCALVGGETAELPDLYAPGEYDLAGFAVGVAERMQIIDGHEIAVGDRVIALASSGLHSNGYALARRVVFEALGLGILDELPGTGRSVADELLEPTRIYAGAILALVRAVHVHGMAHVTGGGIPGNLVRVLPEGCRAILRRAAWPVPPVFSAIQRGGHIADEEMFRTFNMGLGFLIVLPVRDAHAAGRRLEAAGEHVFTVGEIHPGQRGVDIV